MVNFRGFRDKIIDFKDKEQNTEDNKMEEAPFPPE